MSIKPFEIVLLIYALLAVVVLLLPTQKTPGTVLDDSVFTGLLTVIGLLLLPVLLMSSIKLIKNTQKRVAVLCLISFLSVPYILVLLDSI